MQLFLDNLLRILLMLVLLGLSALFSGTETAYFNLSRRQRRALRGSTNKLQHLAGSLLEHPKKLLGSFLLGNMAVNIGYFSLSYMLARQLGPFGGPAVVIGSFFMLLLLGEMLPKSIAFAHSQRIAVAVALPVFFAVRLLGPVQAIITFLIVEPALKLILHPGKQNKPVKFNQLKFLIESSRQQGLISPDECELLAEVVDFGRLKVRQVMRPRVDMVAIDVKLPTDACLKFMDRHNLVRIPVYSGTIDNIIGIAHLRDLLLHPGRHLRELLHKPIFVPEQKTVESLLEFFRTTAKDAAVVIDEFGGLAGWVRLEDIVEELVGPIDAETNIPPVEQIGPMQYRFAAATPIHDWAHAFGIESDVMRLSTIGGLVTALTGRIPRPGDSASIGNLRFEVERVRRHRIETVILTIELLPGPGDGSDR